MGLCLFGNVVKANINFKESLDRNKMYSLTICGPYCPVSLPIIYV